MRIAEWAFEDPLHPVYERPPDEDRWPVALPGMLPARYRERASVVTETRRMVEVGHPSVEVFQTPDGTTIQRVTLLSAYVDQIDLAQIREVAQRWYQALCDASQGPYSLADLREMGHPYGYGRSTTPSWRRLYQPRGAPPMGRRAYLRGIGRGRVSDLSIINRQSGRLARGWEWQIVYGTRAATWGYGVTTEPSGTIYVDFVAPAPYAWFLAHGTIKMRAHGPWATVSQRLLPQLQLAWRNAARAAWQRGVDQARAEREQFGQSAGRAMTAVGGFA